MERRSPFRRGGARESTRWHFLASALAISLLGVTAPAEAACTLTQQKREELGGWITSISNGALTIAKIRKDDDGPTGKRCKLELLFRGEDADFPELLRGLKATYGWSLPERILLKFARALGQGPGSVRSEIIVGETTYATYASSKGELVVLQASVLKSARDAIDVNFTGLTGTFAAEFETPTERTLTLAARRVKDRVVASVRARHPGLHISLSAVDRGAFSIAVDSLQKEVLPNDDWWESIDIAFFVSVVPKKAIVHCSVDGKYGEGIGRPPSEYQDMEPKYSKQLQTYEKALLATAQEALLQP